MRNRFFSCTESSTFADGEATPGVSILTGGGCLRGKQGGKEAILDFTAELEAGSNKLPGLAN
jgi:hypothetical protein